MPVAVYLLGLAVFAQGTSEFMLSGLLQPIATDLGVSIPDTGLLTSAYAVGMVFGGPLMALLTLRMPRRAALVGFLGLFAATHVVGALAPGYGVLMATRVVGAVANAGFWAVATATAISLVPADAKARAMAVVVGGITVACVIGVPGGALLGQYLGWRSAFWAVAALSVAAIGGVLAKVPDTSGGVVPDARRELGVVRDWRLLVTFTTILLAQGAVFCVFTYLGPLLTDAAGVSASWVPGVLVLFGVGSLVGISAGGRLSDARPYTVLLTGLGALVPACAVLGLVAGSGVALVAMAFVLGLLGFGVNPAMSSRAIHLAAAAPTLAGALVASAFNVGNTLGPWLGGLAIDAGLGIASVAWVGAALAVLAVAAALVSLRSASRPAAGSGRPGSGSPRRPRSDLPAGTPCAASPRT